MFGLDIAVCWSRESMLHLNLHMQLYLQNALCLAKVHVSRPWPFKNIFVWEHQPDASALLVSEAICCAAIAMSKPHKLLNLPVRGLACVHLRRHAVGSCSCSTKTSSQYDEAVTICRQRCEATTDDSNLITLYLV